MVRGSGSKFVHDNFVHLQSFPPMVDGDVAGGGGGGMCKVWYGKMECCENVVQNLKCHGRI